MNLESKEASEQILKHGNVNGKPCWNAPQMSHIPFELTLSGGGSVFDGADGAEVPG